MIPFRTANAHHKRLVKRLKLLAPKLRNLYHETFNGHLSRNEIVPISEEEALDCDGNFVVPVLVFKENSLSHKLRIC